MIALAPHWGEVAYEDQIVSLGRGSIRGSDRVVGTGLNRKPVALSGLKTTL